MKEKLGSGNSTRKSEIAEVTAELKVTDSLREHVKKMIKLLNKGEKSIKRTPPIFFNLLLGLH